MTESVTGNTVATHLLVCLGLATLAIGMPNAFAAPQPIRAVDFVELARLSSPQISDDGRYLVYRRSEVSWDENKDVKRLQLVDLRSGSTTQVVEPESAQESFGAVVWAGNHTGFITLLKREDDEHKQAYYYDLAGKTLTCLTDHNEDIKTVVWAPDDSGFYFRADAALPKALADDIDTDWVIPEFETEQLAEVWFFDWAAESSAKVVGGDYHIRSFSLSTDGRSILFARTGHRLIDRQDGELWLYDRETGVSRQVTHNVYAESKSALSPDASQVAFIATVNASGEHYYEDNIFIQSIGEQETTLILPKLAMEMVDLKWDESGEGLYVLGNTGVRAQIYHYRLDSKALTPLTSGDSEIKDWSFDPELRVHTFINVDANSPGEVWLLDAASKELRQVSNEYNGIAASYLLPKQEVFSWRAGDGKKLEGLLVYPANYQKSQDFPLVTITHGGPRSSAQFGSWNLSRYVPVLAGEGYGVFLPNHRGGTGYGDEFMRDMVGNYFNHAHSDVMEGIDALIEEGLADSEQLVKMGWSAGGHMTNKLITITDRFRAASSGAGASDWISMYGETDARFNRTYWFGGSPWEKNAPLESYMRQSVLKDAWRIKTPTLFFVGEDDERVPPTQSIMMYRATKAAGTETKLYIAKGEPHNYGTPAFRLFKINTELAWYAQHLGRESYAATYPEEKFMVDSLNGQSTDN